MSSVRVPPATVQDSFQADVKYTVDFGIREHTVRREIAVNEEETLMLQNELELKDVSGSFGNEPQTILYKIGKGPKFSNGLHYEVTDVKSPEKSFSVQIKFNYFGILKLELRTKGMVENQPTDLVFQLNRNRKQWNGTIMNARTEKILHDFSFVKSGCCGSRHAIVIMAGTPRAFVPLIATLFFTNIRIRRMRIQFAAALVTAVMMLLRVWPTTEMIVIALTSELVVIGLMIYWSMSD